MAIFFKAEGSYEPDSGKGFVVLTASDDQLLAEIVCEWLPINRGWSDILKVMDLVCSGHLLDKSQIKLTLARFLPESQPVEAGLNWTVGHSGELVLVFHRQDHVRQAILAPLQVSPGSATHRCVYLRAEVDSDRRSGAARKALKEILGFFQQCAFRASPV